MAVTFFNIRSGEKKTCYTEPMISAFFNSTNLHVNATVGQDMGWRLAPETIKRMRAIQADPQKMAEIAATFQLPLDGIGQTDVLNWISREDAQSEEQQAATADYERQYEEELRKLDVVPKETKSKSQERRETVQKADKSSKTDSANETDSAKIEASNDTKEDK